VTLDADLYSSTIFVLNQLRSWIRPGTFLYFDDLSRPEHEPKAFDEFIRESGLRFQAVAADRSLNNAVFECVATGS
jgi:O-methyltransferase